MPDVTRDKFESAAHHVLESKRARRASTDDAPFCHFQQVPVLRRETSSAKLALLLVRTPFPETAQGVDKALPGPVVSVGKSWGSWVISHGYTLAPQGSPEKLSEQLYVQIT